MTSEKNGVNPTFADMVRAETIARLGDAFVFRSAGTVMLYGPDGKPLYVSSGMKTGEMYTVRHPTRFK